MELIVIFFIGLFLWYLIFSNCIRWLYVVNHCYVFPYLVFLTFLISHSWAYSQVFLHNLVINIAKTYGWENVRNVRSVKCRRGKCPFKEVSVGKVSIGELFFGEVSIWDLSMGKCQSITVRIQFYQWNFLGGIALKSSKKKPFTRSKTTT